MDELIVTVARTGGTEPQTFPHLCPFQQKGASKEFCIAQTGVFSRNRDGCCKTKCNSVLRTCIVCLALGLRGREAKYVSDPETGFCTEHADKMPDELVPQKFSPAPLSKKVASTRAVAPPAPPPPSESLVDEQEQPEAQEAAEVVANRYRVAMREKGKPPSLKEVSAAVVQMRTTLSNGQVGQKFGYGYASGATWASQIAGLQRIPEDVWSILDEGVRKGRKLSFVWLCSVSRRSVEDQLKLARNWAGIAVP